jgi:hypothetical protein
MVARSCGSGLGHSSLIAAITGTSRAKKPTTATTFADRRRRNGCFDVSGWCWPSSAGLTAFDGSLVSGLGAAASFGLASLRGFGGPARRVRRRAPISGYPSGVSPSDRKSFSVGVAPPPCWAANDAAALRSALAPLRPPPPPPAWRPAVMSCGTLRRCPSRKSQHRALDSLLCRSSKRRSLLLLRQPLAKWNAERTARCGLNRPVRTRMPGGVGGVRASRASTRFDAAAGGNQASRQARPARRLPPTLTRPVRTPSSQEPYAGPRRAYAPRDLGGAARHWPRCPFAAAEAARPRRPQAGITPSGTRRGGHRRHQPLGGRAIRPRDRGGRLPRTAAAPAYVAQEPERWSALVATGDAQALTA